MSSRRRRGLGQGLGALIPGTREEEAEQPAPARKPRPPAPGGGYREVPIDSILPNPYQPRTRMEEAQLDELAASIREHGIIQPLIVTQLGEGAVGERFQLIAGERRWRAAKRAGLEQVPVVVKEASEREMLELALIENIQRADLNPLEEAAAYQQMMEFADLTQNEVADRVGKSRPAVGNVLRLLKLPDPIKSFVWQGELVEGHARQLLRLDAASTMMDVAERIIQEKMTVRQAEAYVDRLLAPPAPRSVQARGLSLHDRDLQRQFTSALGTQVELRRRKKGGQLIIHFESEEDLQSLYDMLMNE